MLLEREGFIFALLMEVLESFIFTLLLDNYMQMVKSWKISSLFFKLESFIFVLFINVLENFILSLLMKAIDEEKKDCKT